MTAHPERRGFYSRFAPKRLEWWTPSIAEVLSGIKSKNSSSAVSDAISRSRKHGVTIFFHLSKLNWFGKLYIKVTRQNGRPNCLDGHQAVGKASLARSSQDLKQSTIMRNHPGGSRPAPNTVSARIAVALHLSAFKIYWKNTWKNKILIKHSACAGNNYEAIQSPQKNFQNHVGFWILWKQCTSTSNTLA